METGVDSRRYSDRKYARAGRQRRRRRIAVVSLVVLLVVGGGVGALWFSPLCSVRTITVQGTAVVPDRDVEAALALAPGTPLMRVNTEAAAQRVAAIARVARSRVQVVFPSTIRVTVVERTAVLYFLNERSSTGPQAHLVDANGVEFAIATPPPGVPELQTPHPGSSDPATRAAVAVLAAAPQALRDQLQSITVRSVSDIRLTLHDGRILRWGSKVDSDRKAAIALALLTRPGHTYDVSSPDLPTVS